MSESSAEQLVQEYGSPLFVYDGDRIRSQYARLEAALPGGARIHYAVKANPSLGILALLCDCGAGAEIASEGELLAVQRSGFAPEDVLFAGPGKSAEAIRAAVDWGALVHAESPREIAILDAIGRERGEPVRAGVRVHVPWGAEEAHAIIGGGAATKFGIPEEEARGSVEDWIELPGVRLASLHVFNASNVRDAEALIQGAGRTFGLAADLAGAGLPLELVDIGGGLGIPYGHGEDPLDVERLGAGLGELLRELRERLPGLGMALEPGRYLVGEAGRLLTTVIDRKHCSGKEFLVVDAGIHNLLRPALVGQPHPVRPAGASPGAAGEGREFRVVGPLCTSLDSFGDHVLPNPGPGQILEICASGAYGYTEAMPGFLSHAVPAEVLLLDGKPHLLRSRQGAERHLDDQGIPDIRRR